MDGLSICAKILKLPWKEEFYQDISAAMFSSEIKTSINKWILHHTHSPHKKRQITQENVLALAVFVKNVLYFKDFT